MREDKGGLLEIVESSSKLLCVGAISPGQPSTSGTEARRCACSDCAAGERAAAGQRFASLYALGGASWNLSLTEPKFEAFESGSRGQF